MSAHNTNTEAPDSPEVEAAFNRLWEVEGPKVATALDAFFAEELKKGK